MTTQELLGSARNAALDNREFRLTPHRTDDSQDTEDVWVWRLEEWKVLEDRSTLLNSRLLT